jgi:hypothetical protein
MMNKQEEFLARVKAAPPVTLQSTPQLTVWPDFKVDLDRVLVRPMEPIRTIGGGVLAKSRRTLEAEVALTNIGQIVDIGPQAWKAVTRDGVDFKKSIGYSLGDWVFWRTKAGSPMMIRKPAHHKVDAVESPRQIILEDRDILGKFASEADARMIWVWVQ